MVIRLPRFPCPRKFYRRKSGAATVGFSAKGEVCRFLMLDRANAVAPLSTPLPRYHLLPAEKERRRSAMDAKTIIGVAMVLFIIGALVFLKIRSKK